MIAKLLVFVVGYSVLCNDLVYAANYTELLEEAVSCLVGYTAVESEKALDSLNIKKRVIDNAQQQFDAKIAKQYPKHCNDYDSLYAPTRSGITVIKPDEGKPFRVYCTMDINGGGWTRISRRSTNTLSFYRTWKSYKNGFGYLSGDGWLGLEKIHRLTKSQPAELLITLYTRSAYYYYPQYKNFSVGSEATAYTLYISNFTGTGGDYLTYSNLAKFSTYDMDNDISSGNCAVTHHGGWWYRNCFSGKLTGEPYTSTTSNDYVKWPGADSYAIRDAIMEIKLFN